MTEATLIAALHDCYDPEIPLNIVDLGLLAAVSITRDDTAPGAGIRGNPDRFQVRITLNPPPPGILPEDQVKAHLTAQIQGRLAAYESISGTEIEFAGTPAWSVRSISPAGRRLLKLDQPGGLIQITPQTTL